MNHRLLAASLTSMLIAGGSFSGPGSAHAVDANEFKIENLSTDVCAVIDTNDINGDSRGGIALSESNVFNVKDGGIAGFLNSDLSGGFKVNPSLSDDVLITDLATKQIYGINKSDDNIASIVKLSGTTGQPLDEANIALTQEVPFSEDSALFVGKGRFVVVDDETNKVYDVSLPGGIVTLAATLAEPLSIDETEYYYRWGMVEYFGGALWLAYVPFFSDAGTEANPGKIVRQNVTTGSVETVFTAPRGTPELDGEWSLSDDDTDQDLTWIVDPVTNRWYLSYEYGDGIGWVAESAPQVLGVDKVDGGSGENSDFREVLVVAGPDCGSDPLITAAGSRKLQGSTQDHYRSMHRWAWLRCKADGSGGEGRVLPRGCVVVATEDGRGARLARVPYIITTLDRRAGYMRLAVQVRNQWFWSSTFGLTR